MILQGLVETSDLFHVEIKHKNIHNVMQYIKIVIEVTLWKLYAVHVAYVMI